VLVGVLIAALVSRGAASKGEAALWSWAATANSAFWAIPLATALAGAEGAVLAVLADRASSLRTAYATHMMRADAPIPQRRRTAWVDQAPMGALVVGLALHGVGAAPHWTAVVTRYVGPWLALSGAMLFSGSVSHDDGREALTGLAKRVAGVASLRGRPGGLRSPRWAGAAARGSSTARHPHPAETRGGGARPTAAEPGSCRAPCRTRTTRGRREGSCRPPRTAAGS